MNKDEFKKDIVDYPILRYFRAGINHNVYWNSSHTKLQLEDDVDYRVVIFQIFDFKFIFDQSLGHTKLRKDGLFIDNMKIFL